MTPFGESLAYSHRATLEFFFLHLEDVATDTCLSIYERAYTASVLAHYAQVSRVSAGDLPISADLSDVFDQFVMQVLLGDKDMNLVGRDPRVTEIAGSQTLLFAGFFRDQMRARHNVKAYDRYGQTFYHLSSQACTNLEQKYLLTNMAENFPVWARTCCKLHRTLRNRYYLINP